MQNKSQVFVLDLLRALRQVLLVWGEFKFAVHVLQQRLQSVRQILLVRLALDQLNRVFEARDCRVLILELVVLVAVDAAEFLENGAVHGVCT